ncbi:MAG: hypothetical protein A2167_09120 [Planctomycetes bacterium RBG_13_46_10]|nr:MAG: hypothetical protein A2167_09120 [Planctomycetes bacterium RBG_13_46_10]
MVILDVFHITFYYKLCAYLDPGTGSIIFQVIIAGLCGGLLAVKIFWSKIKSFFKGFFFKGNKAEEK